jgi:CubicO group peptidase (beta-lactamase class C family)
MRYAFPARQLLRTALHIAIVILIAVGSASSTHAQALSEKGSVDELVGLWKAEHDYGPPERGQLVMKNSKAGWSAEFAGNTIKVREEKNVLSFELPDGRGAFRAVVQRDGSLGHGQWFQLKSTITLDFASSVTFTRSGSDRWIGTVVPIPDEFNFYLLIQKLDDGSVAGFLRNPERNIGARYPIDRISREGNSVQFFGKRRGQTESVPVMKGSFDASTENLSLEFIPELDGAYKFTRVGDQTSFYPRGKTPSRYVYRPPADLRDGWAVGTLDDVDIDRKGIENFVQTILDMPMNSINAMQVDGILIARHGKLVLEEYFHGFDRDTLHSARSASKSLTSVLIGATMQSGLPVKLSEPVYQAMNGGAFPEDLEPKKRTMTLENLMTMSSGFFCDDGNPNAPGNEELLINQTEEPDYYRFSLRIPLDRTPGERAVYCSADPNLAIGVLHRVTGEHPMDLFDRLIAGPLNIPYHAWPISPSRQPYGGGSVNLTPRNFMKFGQLMLNGGKWNSRRILSEEFVKRSTSPLYDLNGIKYGYLWWVIDFPYKNRTVRAFFAGGNGGQGIIVIRELDLVIVTQGSSYGGPLGLEIQQGLPARYILPAVREPGDPKDAPVVPREYKIQYGRKP